MPGVMHAPETVTYEEHEIEEPSQARADKAGFWHRIVQYIRRHRTHTLQSTSSSSHVALHRIVTPADLLAREHPMLYLRVFTGL